MKKLTKFLVTLTIQVFILSASSFAQLCGTKTVGIGGDYTTLTAAIADLNSETLCGALNLVLTDSVYPNEIFPLVINYNPGSSETNTISIKPAPGVSPVISCSTAWTVFLLNGTDHLIIDGSNQIGGDSKDLTIINNYNVENINSVISLRNNGVRGSSNSTIKNCIVKGYPSVYFSYGISIFETAGNGFDNTSILNNSIKNAKIGINFNGISGDISENGIIRSNTIGDEAEPITKGGIYVINSDNIQIDDNEIFGEISGNSNPYQYGISIGPNTTNSKIRKNKIHDFSHTGSMGVGCFGIYFNSESNSPTEISNNLIYNIKGDGDLVSIGNADWIPSGITIKSGGNIQIYFNSINMTGPTLGTGWNSNFAGNSTCFLINSGVSGLDIKNNIFQNSMTTASGNGANKTFGVVCYSSSTAFADIDYNDYYIDGLNPNIGYLSGDIPSLSGWQTATADDNNSVSVNPVFVSPIDLHPTQNSVNNKGIEIIGITTDFSNVTRSNPPDLGGYEYSILPTVYTDTASEVTAISATLNGFVNANNESAIGTFEYGLTTTYGNSIVWSPNPVTGSDTIIVSSDLTGLLPNTTYHFRINATSIIGTSFGNDQSFITYCPLASITSEPVNQTITYGAPANFAVLASDAVSYQWQEDSGSGFVDILESGIYSGVTTENLSISLPTVAMTGYKYRCIVTGACLPVDSTDGNATLIVAGLPIVITPDAGQTKVYGSVDPSLFTYTFTPALIGTDVVSGIMNREAGEEAGTYAYSIGTLSAGPNYSLSVAPAPTFSITSKSLLITAEDKIKCYDGGIYNGGYNVIYSGFVNGEDPGVLNGTLVYSGSAITATNPGSYTIIPSGLISTNYALTYVNGSLIIDPAPSPTITGLNSVCAGTSNIQYTTEPGASNYIWIVSYGGIITSGQNTNQVTVDWGTAGSRTISVNYDNTLGCLSAEPASYSVKVLSVPVPIITGFESVCSGVTDIEYTTQPNYNNYLWAVSDGGIITSGAGTNSITVNWTGSGDQFVSADYTNELGCKSLSPTIYPIEVAPEPGASGPISGSGSVCTSKTGEVYSVTPIDNASTYEWTVPAGVTIVSGAGTNSITVDFTLNASSGNIQVSGLNECGSGAASPDFYVEVHPIPATPVITQHGDTLISNASAGNQWYLDGIAIPGATGSQHIAVYFGVYHVEVSENGCNSSPSNTIQVQPVSINELTKATSFEVYPNPNFGLFNIKIEPAINEEYKIEIFNNIGILVWKQEISGVTQAIKFDLSGYPAGSYIIVLRNKINSYIRKLIIQK